MRHLRADYDAIQPWPTKRPHHAKVEEEGRDGFVETLYLDLTEDSLEQLGGDAGVRPLIPDDEPVFLLRAKDAVAPDVVRLWAHLAETKGADPALVERANAWADEMAAYAATRYAGGKTPDTDRELLR